MSNPELNDLIGQRVRDARKRRRDMSVEEVVAECAKRGLPLTAGQMYLIETRGKEGKPRRRITVDELLTLAYVLEVSPLALLLPEEDGDYPVSGNVTARALAVYEWMIGARLPPKTADGGEDAVSADERAEAWSLLRRSLSYVPAQAGTHSTQAIVDRMTEQLTIVSGTMSSWLAIKASLADVQAQLSEVQAKQAKLSDSLSDSQGEARGEPENQTD